MDEAKRQRLEAQGWKVGVLSDFLRLSPEEVARIELKVTLTQILKTRQEKPWITTHDNL